MGLDAETRELLRTAVSLAKMKAVGRKPKVYVHSSTEPKKTVGRVRVGPDGKRLLHRRGVGRPKKEIQHGTEYCYKMGCRRDECRDASNEARRARLARKRASGGAL